MPMTHSLHIFVEFDLTDLLRSVLLKARQRVRESKNSAEESSNLSGLQVHIFHHHLISYLFHLHWGMLTYVIHRIKIKILGVVTLWAWLLVCLMVVISHCSTFLTLLKSLLRFPSFFFFFLWCSLTIWNVDSFLPVPSGPIYCRLVSDWNLGKKGKKRPETNNINL